MKKEQKRMTCDELSRLAALAQLEFAQAEAELLAADLDAILCMVSDLADVEGGAAFPAAVPLAVLRADKEGESLSREAVLANAADRTDTYIAVPRVVE